MSETRLGVNITATDSAGGTIRQTAAEVKSLESALKQITEGSASFQRANAGLADSLRAEIAALREASGAAGAAAVSMQAYSRAAHAASNSSSLLQRESRHLVSAFDELASGRRGQFMATLGSSIRDAGLGSTGLIVGVAGLAAAMSGAAIIRGAEKMGEFAERTRSAAAAAGQAIGPFSQLQGALELTGAKGESANRALRQFADNVAKAIAKPQGIQAQAFNAIGISIDELKRKADDLPGLFVRVADALGGFAEGANKARASEELFGQGLATVEPLLSLSGTSIEALMAKAKALGITLDAQTAQALINTGMKANELSAVLRGQLIKAFEDLGPAIQSFIGFLETANSWLNKIMSTANAAGAAVHNFISAIGRGMAMGEVPGLDTIIGPGATSGRSSFERGSREGAGVPAEMHLPDVGVIGEAKKKAHKAKVDHGPAKAAMAEYHSSLMDLREQLSSLRRDEQLTQSQIDVGYETSRAADYGGGKQGRMKRAEGEYQAFASAQQQKISALKTYQSQADAIYDQIAEAALKEYAVGGEKYKIASKAEQAAAIWGADSAAYKKAVGDKIAADKEFQIEHQRMINAVTGHYKQIVEVHDQLVQQQIEKWGSAFDKIGDSIEESLTKAIESAFRPMKPEYWYSSVQGPHGVPLTQAHRISPVGQIFGQLGTSVFGELGKTLQSGITEAFAKSLSGGTASTLGQVLSKAIGIGTPGGLFGTGLGAVEQASTQATFAASVGTFAAAVGTFAASNAAGGLSGSIGAGAAVARFFGFNFQSGGIVPSAAGGWALGSFPGSTPALLHQREMVLPEHLSTGLQNMINSGGPGGNVNLHFHGPADAPSISRWFKDNMAANSGVIKQMFRTNSLTPRAI